MYQYKIKSVDHILDGDTLDVTVDLGFNISHKIRLKLYGIGTPGIKKKDKTWRAASKNRLTELVSGHRSLTVSIKEKGKYGRYSGVLYLKPSDAELEYNPKASSTNINLALITEGFAVAYNGGER